MVESASESTSELKKNYMPQAYFDCLILFNICDTLKTYMENLIYQGRIQDSIFTKGVRFVNFS